MKIVLIASLVLISCRTQTVFVVLRDIPENPSFVIIPPNNTLNEVEFANSVESYFTASGVRIIARPISKAVETQAAVGQLESQGNSLESAASQRKETYYAFDDTKADYVVKTYLSNRQVQVIRRNTMEVLTTLELPNPSTPSTQYRAVINSLLKNLGIPVTNTP